MQICFINIYNFYLQTLNMIIVIVVFNFSRFCFHFIEIFTQSWNMWTEFTRILFNIHFRFLKIVFSGRLFRLRTSTCTTDSDQRTLFWWLNATTNVVIVLIAVLGKLWETSSFILPKIRDNTQKPFVGGHTTHR